MLEGSVVSVEIAVLFVVTAVVGGSSYDPSTSA